jgi:nucleotide-binding universal stress UspA family protein
MPYASFRRILVATDFGIAARHALSDASRLAQGFGAEVDVVHVLPARKEATAHPKVAARLEQVTRELIPDPIVRRSTISYGSAAETILYVAERSGADLIVIGAGDQARHSVTGPTAETVARFAALPVWVSRPIGPERISSVMCALNASPGSREALRVALLLRERFSAKLELAHVCEEDSPAPDREVSALEKELAERGVADLPLHVAKGRASDELYRMAGERQVDVMVMGRSSGGLRRVFLGGTAERLLRRLPAALLLTTPRA